MSLEWVAVPLATGTVALLDWFNRRVIGFLPDDPPGGLRKRHHRALPMAGGALGVLGTGWLLLGGRPLLAAGLLLCTAVGVLDDRGKDGHGAPGLPVKISGLLAAATLLALALRAGAPWLAIGLSLGLAFVVINAINFLDNTNGVATVVGTLGILLATGAHGTLAVPGFLFLGFLPFNWPRPRLLLGDGGALSLGYCLAAAALARDPLDGSLGLAALTAPIAVPLLDFTQVVLARVYLGFAPWIGDRRHLTHIAMAGGLPHALVAPLFGIATVGSFVLLQHV